MNIMETIKAAGNALGDPKGSKTDMDILDKLHREHNEIKKLAAALVDSKGAVQRKSLLRKIKAVLVPHSRAEEKTVYDAILALKDKKAVLDGNEGYLEHELADRVLAKLARMSKPAAPAFEATAKVLKELLEHHIEEEEDDVWTDVRSNFSRDERLEMNRRFEAAKRKVALS